MNSHTASGFLSYSKNAVNGYSSLKLAKAGRIGIAAGGKLVLPSPSSIESDGNTQNAIRIDGNGILEFTDGNDTTLDVKNYSIISTGTGSYAGAIRLTAPSTLKVDTDFTVSGLRLDGVAVAPGDYTAASLASDRVVGAGVLHVLSSKIVTLIIIR